MSDRMPSEYSDSQAATQKLIEMFPFLDKSIIERSLNDKKGNIFLAIDKLRAIDAENNQLKNKKTTLTSTAATTKYNLQPVTKNTMIMDYRVIGQQRVVDNSQSINKTSSSSSAIMCIKCHDIGKYQHADENRNRCRHASLKCHLCVQSNRDNAPNISVRNHFQCQAEHRFCISCYFERPTLLVGKCLVAACDQPIREVVAVPHLWIFMDYSNVSISAQKYAGERQQMPIDDSTARIDIGKLTKSILNNSALPLAQKPRCYGSENETASHDYLWTEFRNNGWDCDIKKTTVQNKEKEVDTQLTCDIAMVLGSESVRGGVLVLIGGDRDYLPVIKSATDSSAKWEIQIWSWAGPLANRMRDHCNSFSNNILLVELDHFFDDIVYCDFVGNVTSAKSNPDKTIVMRNAEPYVCDELSAHLKSQRIAINCQCPSSVLMSIKKLLKCPFKICFESTPAIGAAAPNILIMVGSERWYNKEIVDQFYAELVKRFPAICGEFVKLSTINQPPQKQQQQQPIVTQPIGNQQPSMNPKVTDFNFRNVPCRHGGQCRYGLDCRYGHNESEISEFRLKKQLALLFI